jgi:internalin A
LVGQPTEKPADAQAAPAVLEKYWNELADRDKTRAALAMLALAKSPRETTVFLKEHLRPVKIDAKNVAKWLTDLDSDDLRTQTQALENLEFCGKYIRSDLEKALKSASRIETKQVIEELQSKLPPVLKTSPDDNTTSVGASNGSLNWKLSREGKGGLRMFLNDVEIDSSKVFNAPSRPWIRAQRAVAILEQFGTPEARQVLESLASGEAEALPTVAARAALGRRKGAVDQGKLWAELADPDEGKAILALLPLAAKPKETIALFEKCLKPIKIDAKRVAQLLSRLDSGNFAVRIHAMQELESCGPLIRKNLKEAHKNATSLESKRRIEELRAKLPKVVNAPGGRGGIGTSLCGIDAFASATSNGKVFVTINGARIDWENTLGPPQVQWMRAARAVTILEHFGDAEARRLLELVATGEADAPPTVAARAALWRLSSNAPPKSAGAQPSRPLEPTPQQLQAAIQAFAKIGGKFTKETDWTTREPVYIGSLPRSATDEDLKKLPIVPFSFGLSLAGQEKITDAGMANLGSVKNLSHLCLNGTNVTDAGLKTLANLQSLFSLDLSFSKLTNVGVIADLKNLLALNLNGTRVAGSGLREIYRLKELRYLDLGFTDVDDADLREVIKLENLTSLSLLQTMVTDDGIHELADFRNLTYLFLDGKEMTDETLMHLAKITTLAELGLCGTKITDRGLRHLAKLERLTYLDLSFTKVTDHGVRHVAGLRRLKSLDLRYAPVAFAGLEELARLKELSSLSLTGAKVGDAELKEIAKCANLSELKISDSKVADEGMKALANLEKLSSLDLSGSNVTCVGVIGANGFPSLSELTLYSTGVTDAGFNEIVKLKKLSSLNLEQTKITDAGLKGINDLVNLRTLNVSGTKVTDVGLKEIARVAGLKELSFRDAKITDVGVKEIVRLKELSTLDFDNSKVTDSGMRELGKLTKLVYLGLWGTKVSDDVIRDLQKALPNCYISRQYN